MVQSGAVFWGVRGIIIYCHWQGLAIYVSSIKYNASYGTLVKYRERQMPISGEANINVTNIRNGKAAGQILLHESYRGNSAWRQ